MQSVLKAAPSQISITCHAVGNAVKPTLLVCVIISDCGKLELYEDLFSLC